MKRVIHAVAVTLGLFTALPALASDLTITTGGATGTYIQIGQDIQELVLDQGLDVEVAQSRGSVQNLERLLGYEGVGEGKFYQLAIVQEDVLADLRLHAKGNQSLERIVSKIKTVLPLYDEEVHIFVQSDTGITQFEDLRGAVMGVGKPGSGTYMTARFLHRLAGLPWSADGPLLEQLGGEDGINALKDFNIDALFNVAGAPSKLGAEHVQAGDGIELAAITTPSIFDAEDSPYKRAVLDKREYPWLTAPVKNGCCGLGPCCLRLRRREL